MEKDNTRIIEVTENFEANLELIRCYHLRQNTIQKYELLLDELFESTIPTLELHPFIGSDFLQQTPGSVESERLAAQLQEKISGGESIRKYTTRYHQILYLVQVDTLSLLAIRHHQQLTFELRAIPE